MQGALALILFISMVGVLPRVGTDGAPCDVEPSMPLHTDAVVEREVLADVDGDGRRELLTGYTRPNGEAYLHVRFQGGWSTAIRLDEVDTSFTHPRPESVVEMAERPVIVVMAGPNAVGASFAFFVFQDCGLVLLTLATQGIPEIWIGIGPSHSEWFSCRQDGVVQVQVFERSSDPNGQEGATITLYPLEGEGFGTAVVLADDVTRRTAEVTSEFPECSRSGTFLDDDSTKFEADLEWLAARGYLRGCNPPANDRACPNDSVTRGQVAALLNRSLRLAATTVDHFTDDDNTVYAGDIDRLAAAGISRGCNPPANDRFCPSGTVTRGQAAAFLARALDLPPTGTDHFTDDDNSVFEDDIDRLANARITFGCNPPANDRFCPDAPLTRAQMAALLRRALD